MRIGQDASMQTNISDGYLIMEFKKRDLFTNGVLNRDCYVRFIQHAPDYIKKETNWRPGMPSLITDVSLSANDVLETYNRYKDGIDSMCGGDNVKEIKDEWDLLSMASDVSSYCGLY